MNAIDRLLRRFGTDNVPFPDSDDSTYAGLYGQYVTTYKRLLNELENRGLDDLAEETHELVAVLDEIEIYARKYAYLAGLMKGMSMAQCAAEHSPASRVR